MARINLGDLAKDRITGFTGIVTGKASYLTGCDRCGLAPQKLKDDGGVAETLWFDEPWVEVVEQDVIKPVEQRKADAGGPSRSIDPGNRL